MPVRRSLGVGGPFAGYFPLKGGGTEGEQGFFVREGFDGGGIIAIEQARPMVTGNPGHDLYGATDHGVTSYVFSR